MNDDYGNDETLKNKHMNKKNKVVKESIERSNKDVGIKKDKIKLIWGGRPFKKKPLETKLPNTSICNGVVVLDKQYNYSKENTGKKKKMKKNISDIAKKITLSYEKGERLLEFDNNDDNNNDNNTEKEGKEIIALSGNALVSTATATTEPNFLYIQPSFSNNYDLIDFFIKESCKMFSPTPLSVYHNNPFYTIFPQLIFADLSLINLCVVFGSNHRERINNPSNTQLIMGQQLNMEILKIQQRENQYSGLSSSFSYLSNFPSSPDNSSSNSSNNSSKDISNSLLCSILLLSCFSFQFPQKNWRTYIYSFKKLLQKKFSKQKNGQITITIVPEQSLEHLTEFQFLMNWFNYLDVVSTLTSVKFQRSFDNTYTPLDSNEQINEHIEEEDEYYYDDEDNFINYHYDLQQLDSLRVQLKDIEFFSGLDLQILYYLTKISRHIVRKQRNNNSESWRNETMILLLDLKKNLESYMTESERQRDYIQQIHYRNGPFRDLPLVETYKSLRATNMIFGLNGLLQLNRRVLNLSFDHIEIKSLLLKCLAIINEKIPLGSPSSQCILSCLFTIGCDLVNEGLISYRHIITTRMDSLTDRGVAAALEAKNLMQHCWLNVEKKNWWDIMMDQKIDISFCL